MKITVFNKIFYFNRSSRVPHAMRCIEGLFLILFMALPYVALAKYGNQDESPMFRQANKLYHQEDMQEALELYKQITEKGYAVWYNMGNCYYHLADPAHAIVCWQRAQQQANSIAEFDATEYGIELARTTLGQKRQQSQLSYMVRRSATAVSPFIAQLLFILCSCLLLVLGKKLCAARRFCMLSMLGGSWLLLSILVLVHYDELTVQAIVVSESAPVRAAPHAELQSLGALSQGVEVAVKQKQAAWYNIRGNGIGGWVSAQDVEIV